MLAFILVAQIASTASAPSPFVPIDSARVAADRFVRTWRYYWESGETLHLYYGRTINRPQRLFPPLDADGHSRLKLTSADSQRIARERSLPGEAASRFIYRHCHPEWADPARAVTEQGIPLPPPQPPLRIRNRPGLVILPSDSARHIFKDNLIVSGVGSRAVCPTWFPDVRPPWDERTGIDNSLIQPAVEMVRAARSKLLDLLDASSSRQPDNAWAIGQRVRFALDQADTTRAERAARECAAETWWCGMLRGRLLAARGNVETADSTFARAIADMPDSIACALTDLRSLVDAATRSAYVATACGARAAFNDRIWWLSDPLWTVRANDRRVEHYSRVVDIKLLTGTLLNERLDLRDVGGGTAAREMLLRYGRPTVSPWGGWGDDSSHYGYLGIEDGSLMDHGRFVTSEYTQGRMHPVPSWNAIQNPFAAIPTDWTINARAFYEVERRMTEWWPQEHFDRGASPVVQLVHQQALFRRDEAALLAFASNFYAFDFDGRSGDTLVGAIIFSTSPDSMRFARKGVITGFGAAFREAVEPRPQMIGLEMFGPQPTGVIARTRFGIEPPIPLSRMRAGERAMSDVALLDATDTSGTNLTDPNVALPRMHGTTVFGDLRRFGLYWETYGIALGDTVDVAITMNRITKKEGILRKIAIRIGVSGRRDGSVTVRWREPASGQRAWYRDGRIPIQGRHVTLNAAALEPGEYSLTVSMIPIRGQPLESTRYFSIEAGARTGR